MPTECGFAANKCADGSCRRFGSVRSSLALISRDALHFRRDGYV